MEENKPGEVVVPVTQQETSSPTPDQAPIVAAQVSDNMSASAQTDTGAPANQHPNAQTSLANPFDASEEAIIRWEADEFIAQDKTKVWYGIVMAVSVGITLLVYLLNRDIVTSALVFIALAGLAAFGGRRPRRQEFVVAPEGIQVGKMFYAFADFRSFAVAEEKVGHSLVLVSLKRFVPAINIYIPPEHEEAVVDLVASILPMEAHRPDFVERFMNRIRF